MHVNSNKCIKTNNFPRQNSLSVHDVHSNLLMADVFTSGNHAKEVSGECQVLPTLLLPVKTKQGVKKLRALLDTGSTASFIAAESLKGLPHKVIESGISLMIRSIQGSRSQQSNKVEIRLSEKGKGGLTIVCFVVPYISQIYRDQKIRNINHPEIRKLSLNEPLSQRQGGIDILLGTPHFWQVVKEIKFGARCTRYYFWGCIMWFNLGGRRGRSIECNYL